MNPGGMMLPSRRTTHNTPFRDPLVSEKPAFDFERNLNLFLQSNTPLFFYQKTLVRRVTVISLALCAGASLIKAGSITRHDASLRNMTFLFWTALGLTTACASIVLGKRTPHSNDPQYRASLIQSLRMNWPFISEKDLKGKYAPILNSDEYDALLHAQLSDLQQKLERSGAVVTRSALFEQFLQLHSLKTLGDLLTQNATHSSREETVSTEPEVGCPPESAYPALPHLNLPCSSYADVAGKTHLFQWDDLVETLLADPDTVRAKDRLQCVLRSHKNTVFQCLSAGTRQALLNRLPSWLLPYDRFDEVEVVSIHSLHAALEQIQSSEYFDWERDVYVPLLVEKLFNQGVHVLTEVCSLKSPCSIRRFASAVSDLCVDDAIRRNWATQINACLSRSRVRNQCVLVGAFAGISDLWKEALMPCIKQTLVYHEPAMRKSAAACLGAPDELVKDTCALLVSFLNSQDAEVFRQLQSPSLELYSSSYFVVKEAFLATSTATS